MSNGPDYPHLGTRIGRWLGPLLAIAWFATAGAHMPQDARVVLALAIWMAVWWMTEAVPLSVTSLLPLVVLPLFSGLGFSAVASPYASGIVFLLMGGFMLGLALQRHSGLHRRIALSVLALVGAGQRQLVGGFMLVTALISVRPHRYGLNSYRTGRPLYISSFPRSRRHCPRPQDVAVGPPFLTDPRILWYARFAKSGADDDM